MTDAPAGRTAFVLGIAGLLPQLAAVALIAVGERWAGAVAAFYPLLILSFLGGMWWGLAMRRDPGQRGTGQGALVAVAVVPSLVALALGFLVIATQGSGWSLVAIGAAVMATLPVDRRLTLAGDAPANWMRLRVPLSLGLGGLTIVAGALLGSPVAQY